MKDDVAINHFLQEKTSGFSPETFGILINGRDGYTGYLAFNNSRESDERDLLRNGDVTREKLYLSADRNRIVETKDGIGDFTSLEKSGYPPLTGFNIRADAEDKVRIDRQPGFSKSIFIATLSFLRDIGVIQGSQKGYASSPRSDEVLDGSLTTLIVVDEGGIGEDAG